MKYLLIVGSKDAGKSSTVDAVCKALNPDKVSQLNIDKQVLEPKDNSNSILNGTYLLEVDGKIILVVAGSPTEQGYTITIIIEIFIRLKIKIDFAIVSMRVFEKREGYDTRGELKKFGECIFEKRIWRIESEDFRQIPEWKSRIEEIVKLIQAA